MKCIGDFRMLDIVVHLRILCLRVGETDTETETEAETESAIVSVRACVRVCPGFFLLHNLHYTIVLKRYTIFASKDIVFHYENCQT